MQSELDSRQFGELKWGAAIWAWFKDNCLRIEMTDEVWPWFKTSVLRIEMTDDIWAWFKTIVLRIEMGHAIQAWFKAIWRIEMGSCNLSLIQRQLFEDWNERWSLSLIQDNCFEDRNGTCNPNLIEDNCLGIQMRNATKLDSRQL
jgi:hypothetical protein